MIPSEWTPRVPIRRIHWHWNAGAYVPNATDLRAYHLLTTGEGEFVRGIPSIAANSGTLKPGYSAHTLNANTDAISVALCCMGGARERPLDLGRWPMLERQVEALCLLTRVLSERYEIPISRSTTLSHAEVESTLGVPQRAKWDFTILPFRPDLVGAHAVGDWIRAQIGGVVVTEPQPVTSNPNAPVPAGAIATVRPALLNARRAPGGEIVGTIPRGTSLEVVGHDGAWLRVETPAGFTVWVHGDHVDIVDGPPPHAPTTPSPARRIASDLRRLAAEIEALA
jgi:hypothetical protein